MASPSAQEITGLLVRWGQGDEQALDSLVPLLYNRLRRLAAYLLQGERSGHTLQPTALVNEAYLKLAGQANSPWQNRAHFFAVAGRAMRQILVDYARQRRREKRGGGVSLVPLEEGQGFVAGRSIDLLALDEALDRLAADDKRKALVVELRYFGGLSNQEIAEALQVSVNTVMRDWDFAKAWLSREMSGSTDERGNRRKAAKKS
jgi:RNA polymerase sigma factor (TIGR02999 family)